MLGWLFLQFPIRQEEEQNTCHFLITVNALLQFLHFLVLAFSAIFYPIRGVLVAPCVSNAFVLILWLMIVMTKVCVKCFFYLFRRQIKVLSYKPPQNCTDRPFFLDRQLPELIMGFWLYLKIDENSPPFGESFLS